MKIENPLGAFDYIIKGNESSQIEEAAKEFKKELDYIYHLPYNMTNTAEQAELVREKIEQKYNVEIGNLINN